MRTLHGLRALLHNLFRREHIEDDLDAEVRAHLDLLADEKVLQGMSPPAARRAARIELGGIEELREEVREVRTGAWVDAFVQDFRFGARQLRRNPGFTAVAVLTLALGVGANTAIFSVIDAILLKPLPYPHSEQLYLLFQENEHDRKAQRGWSYSDFQELREHNHVFSEIAGMGRHELTVTGHGEPTVVATMVVTPGFFSLLETNPLAGRCLTPEDGKPGAPPVVVLSEDLWRGLFQGDARVIGASINLDKRPFTVVGIMPRAFRPALAQSKLLWIPVAQDPLFGPWVSNRNVHFLPLTARLMPGVTVTQAQAELETINARLIQEFPAENTGWAVRMSPLRQLVVGDVRPALLMLWWAVALVLLIACANIANLLLARATARSREIAVRATLGAGRARIVRQLLSESVVLGLLGGAAGVALAYWCVHALSSLLPQSLPQVNTIRVDAGVLGFGLVLSLLASCAFGLAPAFLAANQGLQLSLREGSAGAGESSISRSVRRVLAVAETALAMVLLLTAGLLLRSYAGMVAMSPGFAAERVLKVNLALPRTQYSTPQQWLAFTDELLARIHAQPGLQEAALVVPTPIADRNVTLPFDIVGSPAVSAGAVRRANYVAVSTGYFRMLQIPLLAGRSFDESDSMSRPRVALISKTMARIYFPAQDPIGKQLRFAFPPDSDAPREIVGIVGDVSDVGPGTDPGPMMYVPFAQSPLAGADLLVRSPLEAAVVLDAIRREVAQVDKDLPLGDIEQLPEAIHSSLAQPRFRTLLLTLFAAIALVLAATGIFGVISYSVSRRTQEIGVRMALGASRGTILRMVLGETLGLALTGLALGVPCALAASGLFRHMLFGVSVADPATLAAVAFALVAAAVLAGYVPVRRAMRVDPMVALRHE